MNECSGLCSCSEDDTIFLVKIYAYLRMCIAVLVLVAPGRFLIIFLDIGKIVDNVKDLVFLRGLHHNNLQSLFMPLGRN